FSEPAAAARFSPMADDQAPPPAAVRSQYASGLDETLEFRLVTVTTEQVVLEYDVRPKHFQPYGIVHGGVHCAAIETACSAGAGFTALRSIGTGPSRARTRGARGSGAAPQSSASFWRRRSALMRHSIRIASLHERVRRNQTSVTGKRARVYRDARPAACCARRRVTS